MGQNQDEHEESTRTGWVIKIAKIGRTLSGQLDSL